MRVLQVARHADESERPTRPIQIVDEFRLIYSPMDVVARAAKAIYPNPSDPEAIALAAVVSAAREYGYASPESTFDPDAFYRLRSDASPCGITLTAGDQMMHDAESAIVKCSMFAEVRRNLEWFGFDLSDGVGLKYRNPHKPRATGAHASIRQ